MTKTIKITTENFEQEVIEKSNEVPVVVDFWAPWCSPCIMLGPIIEKLAEEYNGKFILAKLNVDENPEISAKYRVMSIPSVKIFKNGEVSDEFIGLLPEDSIREWLDKNL